MSKLGIQKLALALSVLVWTSCPGADRPGDVYCVDDYRFRVQAPANWTTERTEIRQGLNLKFSPPAASTELQASTIIDLSLPVVPPGGFKPPQEAIEGILGVVAFSRSSEEAGPFPFDHSRYPVAAAHIVKGDDHLYMVIVDAETDPRYQLMATLHKTGVATEKELSTFSDLLESLVFDPELVCPTGNTGQVPGGRREVPR